MAVLLDTHAFLWWCEDAPELSKKARKAIAEQDCHVSSQLRLIGSLFRRPSKRTWLWSPATPFSTAMEFTGSGNSGSFHFSSRYTPESS